MDPRPDKRFRQKSSLSQVFLKENWPCVRVAQNLARVGVQRVLEIGPGQGVLTQELLRVGLAVTVVEKDDRLIESLHDLARSTAASGGKGSLEVIHQDILKFDLAEWLDLKRMPNAVVGNIPYNISSPIVLWLVPHIAKMQIAQLLVQHEFAKRLAAKPETKDYGSLSVFCQLRAHPQIDFKVERTCFKPVPKVDSAMISFTKRVPALPERTLEFTERFTRACFMQRRKMLRNSLKAFLKDFPENILNIDLDRRAETLSPQEFFECGMVIEQLSSKD